MNLKHIDNNHYRLTPAQARKLAGGKLPRPGYEKAADVTVLADVSLFYRPPHEGSNWKPSGVKPAAGWVLRTQLSYHDGETIEGGMVWALHVTK